MFTISTPTAPASAATQPATPRPVRDNFLATLKAAGGAGTLSAKLGRDGAGLGAILREQATRHNSLVDELVPIIVCILRRHMVDGKPVGSVRSWRFFEDAIGEEMHARDVAQLGVRPARPAC